MPMIPAKPHQIKPIQQVVRFHIRKRKISNKRRFDEQILAFIENISGLLGQIISVILDAT